MEGKEKGGEMWGEGRGGGIREGRQGTSLKGQSSRAHSQPRPQWIALIVC